MFTPTLVASALLGLPVSLHGPAAPEPAAVIVSRQLDDVAGGDLSVFESPRKGPELSVHWGTFGIADSEVVFEGGLEYRFAAQTLFEGFDLHPIAGTSLLADGGTYVYAGARHEWYLSERLFVAPSFAAGIYQEGGVDLGGPLEFRSGLDLGYRLSDRVESALGIYHLSNGGLYALNGGAESLLFSVAYGF